MEKNMSGWWFGTFGLVFHILGISYSQLFIFPTDELIFFRGVETTNQMKLDMIITVNLDMRITKFGLATSLLSLFHRKGMIERTKFFTWDEWLNHKATWPF